MKFLVVLFAVVILNSSNECSCGYNVQRDFARAEIVFKAKVEKIHKLENNKSYGQKAELNITKTYKGAPESKIFVELGGCSTPRLSSNMEWVFFTNKENNIQVLGSCNPSFRLEPKDFIRKNPERLKTWKNQLEKKLSLLDTLSKKSLSN